MDLLTRLKTGREAVRVVPIGGVSVGFRLLTEADYQDAGFAARQLLKDRGEVDVLMSTSDLLEGEKAVFLLSRAVIDPVTKKPVFDSVDEAREALGREWKSALTEAYLNYERECSPSARTLDGPEFERLIEEVKKSAETTDLSALNGATLKKLVLFLASPLSSLQTASGST